MIILEPGPEEIALWEKIMQDLDEAWRISFGGAFEPALVSYKFEKPGRFSEFEIMWSRAPHAKRQEVVDRILQLGPYPWTFDSRAPIPTMIGVSAEDEDRWHLYAFSNRCSDLVEIGKFDEAEAALKSAIAEATEKFGDTFPQLAQAHLLLANLYRTSKSDESAYDNHLDEGIAIYQRAFDQGPKHFASPFSQELRKAAEQYESRGNLTRAAQLWRHGLKIGEALVDSIASSPRTYPIECARFFERHNLIDDAEWAYLHSVDQIRVDELHNSPRTSGADNLNELGNFYLRQNRNRDAELAFERLLKLYEELSKKKDGSLSYLPEFQWFVEYKELLKQQNRVEDLSKIEERVLRLEQRAGRKTSSESAYGYVDFDGHWVIEPRYVSAYSFSNGIARVELETTLDKYKPIAYIDKAGNQLFNRDFAWGDSFNGDFACVAISQDRKDRRVIDSTGKLLPERFVKVHPFSDDLAIAEVGHSDPPFFGYIDRQYQLAIPAKFTVARKFQNGLAIAAIDGAYEFSGCTQHLHGCKFGVIDKTGKFVVKPIYSKLTRVADDVFDFRLYEKHSGGLIDKTGKVLLDLPYAEDSWELSEGLIPFSWHRDKSDSIERYGFVDLKGNIVIDRKFSFAYPFSEGRALVTDYSRGSTGNGFIDKTGELVVSMQFSDAESFCDGVAAVEVIKDDKKRWGFIDLDGKFVVPPKFERVSNFAEGLACVQLPEEEGGNYGYIDKSEDFALPAIYKDADSFYDNRAIVTMENMKKGIIDRNGKFILQPEYSSISRFSEGLSAVCKEPNYNTIIFENKNGSFSIR